MQRLPALHDGGHTARLAASRCHGIRTAAARQLNFPPSIAQVRDSQRYCPEATVATWAGSRIGPTPQLARYSRSRARLVL